MCRIRFRSALCVWECQLHIDFSLPLVTAHMRAAKYAREPTPHHRTYYVLDSTTIYVNYCMQI